MALLAVMLILVTMAWAGSADRFWALQAVWAAQVALVGTAVFAVAAPRWTGTVAGCGLLVALLVAATQPSGARALLITDPSAPPRRSELRVLRACCVTGLLVGAGASAWLAPLGVAVATVPLVVLAIANVVVATAWGRRIDASVLAITPAAAPKTAPQELIVTITPEAPEAAPAAARPRPALPEGTELVALCDDGADTIAIVDAPADRMGKLFTALCDAGQAPSRMVAAAAWRVGGASTGQFQSQEADAYRAAIRAAAYEQHDVFAVTEVTFHGTAPRVAIISFLTSRALAGSFGDAVLDAVAAAVPGLDVLALVRATGITTPA